MGASGGGAARAGVQGHERHVCSGTKGEQGDRDRRGPGQESLVPLTEC